MWNGSQDNDDNGKFATGIIVRSYKDGHYINVTFEVSIAVTKTKTVIISMFSSMKVKKLQIRLNQCYIRGSLYCKVTKKVIASLYQLCIGSREVTETVIVSMILLQYVYTLQRQ